MHTLNTLANTVISGIVVIMLALCLQIKHNPFESDLLNRAETVRVEKI
jgi:hypothetical protein